ncbi:MAG: baseplate J/gp47 family protein, partial [Myxococcota bacterium]
MLITATDSHLHDADADAFARDARATHEQTLRRATQDLLRDLQGHGYMREAEEQLVDARASATVTLTLTAHADGDVTVPASTPIWREIAEVDCPGVPHVTTDAPVTIPAGGSAQVACTASVWGEPHNLPAGSITHTDIDGITSVLQAAPAMGGVDHQLARATVYRALELLYADQMRTTDDALDAKRRLN